MWCSDLLAAFAGVEVRWPFEGAESSDLSLPDAMIFSNAYDNRGKCE